MHVHIILLYDTKLGNNTMKIECDCDNIGGEKDEIDIASLIWRAGCIHLILFYSQFPDLINSGEEVNND